jgi:hypothetical protein
MHPDVSDPQRIMTAPSLPVRADQRWRDECIRYSICTIVNDPTEYGEMVDSFRDVGFNEPDCEFLYLENVQENSFDCYFGNNLFLNVARGEHIILCHQDIVLIGDGRARLDAAIAELTKLDPGWAVCGNGGGVKLGQLALRITDPYGVDQRIGSFPARVRSLDENFIVVRRMANLALSRDLAGFHLHGADICILADILGYNCYVIDFHLRHKSPGSKNSSFFAARDRMIAKYQVALRPRWITTTCTSLYLSGIPGFGRLFSGPIATRTAYFFSRKSSWLGTWRRPTKQVQGDEGSSDVPGKVHQ